MLVHIRTSLVMHCS